LGLDLETTNFLEMGFVKTKNRWSIKFDLDPKSIGLHFDKVKIKLELTIFHFHFMRGPKPRTNHSNKNLRTRQHRFELGN
jgi:hypothetical protein